jgi:hypothetical protein
LFGGLARVREGCSRAMLAWQSKIESQSQHLFRDAHRSLGIWLPLCSKFYN